MHANCCSHCFERPHAFCTQLQMPAKGSSSSSSSQVVQHQGLWGASPVL
jgi:hypothetical protein